MKTDFPKLVWQCQNCQNLEIIRDKKDFLKQKYSTNEYLILRHGETDYQSKLKKIIYPYSRILPIGLTERGRNQIEALIPKLKRIKINLIFSSDYFRTKETAGVIAKELRLGVSFDERLREMNLGIYHRRPREELYRDFPDIKERFYRKPKNGESWLNCRKRMIGFIKEIDKKYQDKTILIISHGDPLWLLEGAMRGLSQDELVKQKVYQKTIKAGELRQIKFTSLPFNRKTELDFHQPYVDKVKFYCKKCGDLMEKSPK